MKPINMKATGNMELMTPTARRHGRNRILVEILPYCHDFPENSESYNAGLKEGLHGHEDILLGSSVTRSDQTGSPVDPCSASARRIASSPKFTPSSALNSGTSRVPL